MRVEWIDDILAVLDCGSLAQAAQKRALTQSAFTRRVRTIEDSLGTTLIDRRRKPVSLMPGVQSLEPELRELSSRLHNLRQTLRTANKGLGKPLTFVCQHALTTTISPQVVHAATRNGETTARVRSGNQDECLMMLLSKEVDLAIMYALPNGAPMGTSTAFETLNIDEDIIVPVCAPGLLARVTDEAIPVIAYPSDVFLGQVFTRMLSPRLAQDRTMVTVAETALTFAMLELTLNEIGIAWLPSSLVARPLAQGDLIRLDDTLPAQILDINMVRLRGGETEHSDLIWRNLARHFQVTP
ncbi:LysR family transcriptional regulator [Loktanella sp. Alg231-35]|uniref:LysR family transcriptional regulator n=1 Tax=Loktanella sp. Alg231-35 TaxID=1922220 RepID=UPI000D5609DF|nr:LysR family transcriptional regulator [Loktanella sp. Alg231-35]